MKVVGTMRKRGAIVNIKKLFNECFKVVKANEDIIDTELGRETYDTIIKMRKNKRFFDAIGHPITDREKTAAVVALYNYRIERRA